MSCIKELSAYKRGCKAPGGVDSVILWNKAERELNFTVTEAAKLITFTPVAVPPLGGLDVYKYAPEQGNIFFTQAGTDNNNVRSRFVTHSLTMNLHGLSEVLAALADSLGEGVFEGIATMENGKHVVFGLNKGLQSEGGDAGFSGTNFEDGNGITVVLVAKEKKSAPFISDANLASFLSSVNLNE